MRELSREERALLTRVLPGVAMTLRGEMTNLYLAAKRLAAAAESEGDPDTERDAARFLQSYYRLHRAVGNLSDAPKLAEEGRFSLFNGDLTALTRTVCTRAEALFAEKNVALRFESAEKTCVIGMDAALLERLLLNLLSNALRYTPAGGCVTVSLRREEGQVLLTVADTGCGIAPERREEIFEAYLAPVTLARAGAGAGLGLALCRRIAEGHGGTLDVASAPGEGAAFTLALPDERSTLLRLREPTFDYAGGFDRTLLELADALPSAAFLGRFPD